MSGRRGSQSPNARLFLVVSFLLVVGACGPPASSFATLEGAEEHARAVLDRTLQAVGPQQRVIRESHDSEICSQWRAGRAYEAEIRWNDSDQAAQKAVEIERFWQSEVLPAEDGVAIRQAPEGVIVRAQSDGFGLSYISRVSSPWALLIVYTPCY